MHSLFSIEVPTHLMSHTFVINMSIFGNVKCHLQNPMVDPIIPLKPTQYRYRRRFEILLKTLPESENLLPPKDCWTSIVGTPSTEHTRYHFASRQVAFSRLLQGGGVGCFFRGLGLAAVASGRVNRVARGSSTRTPAQVLLLHCPYLTAKMTH